MPTRIPTFTSENIIAILQAAPKGGTLEEVILRSRVNISANSLAKWIKDGNRDSKEGKHTSYRLFADQWNAVYPGTPPRHEAARMLEIKKALKELGIQHCDQPAAPASKPLKSPAICECGNSKPARAPACDDCRAKGSTRAA